MVLNRSQRRKLKMQLEKPRYIMTNLVYGNPYTGLFLDNQLKTLLDPSNLPALAERYSLEYGIFTDEETMPMLTRHPNFLALGKYCDVNLVKISWPPDSDRFGSRYPVLVQIFHQSLQHALEVKAKYLSVWVADLVFAKDCLPRILGHMEKGHDGVMMVPIRSAADALLPAFGQLKGAPDDRTLFEMAYNNLHHLWDSCHWESAKFTRMPYSMIWNSYTGLLAHHFGITPIVFEPKESMRNVKGVIDADVPAFCNKPYWCEDWTDAPVAGVEPWSNGHVPSAANHKASVEGVAKWSKIGTMLVQAEYLSHAMYYPDKRTFNEVGIAMRAQGIIDELQSKLEVK